MARKMHDPSVDLEADVDYVRILIYSESGAGKTVLGGSDVSPGTLFISPDANGPQSSTRMGGNGKRWPINHWDDIDACHEYWYNWSIVEGKPIPYRWFCIDTLTEVQDLGMDSIMKNVVENNPSRDPYIPAQGDHYRNQLMLVAMVKEFNRLPVNILYTAWALQYTDADGQECLIPDIRGGTKKGHTVSKEICGMMTSFGHLQVRRVAVSGQKEKKEVRRITWENRRTTADGLITGKDRTNVLKPHTDDLTLKEIRERIEASNKKGEAAPRRTARKTTSGTRRVSSRRKGNTSGT
jgi:hypothetical protein